MNFIKKTIVAFFVFFAFSMNSFSQSSMQNVMGRECRSLNGRWAIITDIQNIGIQKGWYKSQTVSDPLKHVEVRYDGGSKLNVPGDWNSQMPELVYFEGPMWYERTFNYVPTNKREFIHFAAVCSNAIVYLNGKELGKHKGGYTPFQFEVTDKLKKGSNELIVRVDNTRNKNDIPSLQFDWWNYGGITRDVNLVSTPKTYIKDYWVRLDKESTKHILVDVQLDGENRADNNILFSINGTKISKKLRTNAEGFATISFDANIDLWSPGNPKLYDIELKSDEDYVNDRIGFRSFTVKGNELLLNGKSIFLKGVNMHEEIAQDKRRAIDKQDAEYLVNKLLDLGCNYVRLAHYPQNEYIVRLCEQKGIMMWEEIPAWGVGINYENKETCLEMDNMMKEMIQRDKNRCGIVMWSVANETSEKSIPRLNYLKGLISKCKKLDNTRPVTAAMNSAKYDPTNNKLIVLKDSLADYVDIIGINKYMGWYHKWLANPTETEWITRVNKPMIISEFGAGGVYANYGDANSANTWSEGYMEKVYKDNLASFEKIPNYRGCTPWVLFDFRSPRRCNSIYQQGWNRKGLLSPDGDKKRAWYVMKEYYKTK